MIIKGDALQQLKILPENSVDSIITDPPYGLNFMGKKWDYDVPSIEIWEEALRVVKPGGFLLSFAGTRTYHRMAVNIEDAGFEIRDMISWLYGSGFPKSLNIGKQIDKIQGNEREFIGEKVRGDVQEAKQNGNTFAVADANKNNKDIFGYGVETLTKGNSEWEGWGTALKPACEPIVVARKPLSEKNVALNVLKWGTGGINIDECRVETEDNLNGGAYSKGDYSTKDKVYELNTKRREGKYEQPQGRFPANIILDEEAGKILDEQSGELKSGSMKKAYKYTNNGYSLGKPTGSTKQIHNSSSGGASRFFYCAKASKSERNLGCDELDEKQSSGLPMRSKDGDRGGEGIDGTSTDRLTVSKNNHPTVKPIKLMEYLVKLVSREGSTILDPFLGSGTTAIACQKLNRKWIGIEREEDYIKICEARLKPFMEQRTLSVNKASEGKE